MEILFCTALGVLTAIVIGFAMTAFVVALSLRALGELRTDHVDGEEPRR